MASSYQLCRKVSLDGKRRAFARRFRHEACVRK
jgi:hypothetical protein